MQLYSSLNRASERVRWASSMRLNASAASSALFLSGLCAQDSISLGLEICCQWVNTAEVFPSHKSRTHCNFNASLWNAFFTSLPCAANETPRAS